MFSVNWLVTKITATDGIDFTGNATLNLGGSGPVVTSPDFSGKIKIEDGVTATIDTTGVTGSVTPYASAFQLGPSKTGGFTKTGSVTLTLSAANTYTGATTLNGGCLNAGVAENAGTSGPFGNTTAAGTILFGGGTLQYSTANQYDYSSRFSTAGSQPISIDANGQTVTFATAIQGSGTSLTLTNTTGTGVISLTAANTYDGGTAVNAGNLSVNNTTGSGTGSGAVTVNSGGTLGGTGTVNGTVAVSGTLDAGASASVGTLTLKGNVSFAFGATYHVDISGGNCDVIDLGTTAALTLTSGAKLDIGSLVAGNTYVIARNIKDAPTGTFQDTSGNVLENNSELHLQSGWYIHYVSNGTSSYIVINQSSTPVVLLQLQALTLGGKVTVRWSTSSESKTAGFDLYRIVNGQSVKLNDTMISAKGWPNGGVGASYSVADSSAQPGQTYTYKLVERTTDGQSIDYGPYDRTVSEFMMKPLEVTAAGAKVRWLSRTGEKYRVLKSTDLTSGQYQPIAENIAATPPENEYLDDAPGNSGFYRIELKP